MRYILLPLLLLPGAALAHPGHHHDMTNSFAYGLAHPITGLDHLVAMFAVGLVAALLGGRAAWAVPGSFLAGMLAFGLIGVGAAESDLAEHLIIASVLLLGAVLALALRPPLALLAGFAAVFGAAHGYAHGVEGTGDGGFLLGFMLATAALHGAGFAAGHWAGTRPRLVMRSAGGLIVLAGVALALA